MSIHFDPDISSGLLREIYFYLNTVYNQGQAPILNLRNLGSGECFLRFIRQKTDGTNTEASWVTGVDTSHGPAELHTFLIFRDAHRVALMLTDSERVGINMPDQATLPQAQLDVRGDAQVLDATGERGVRITPTAAPAGGDQTIEATAGCLDFKVDSDGAEYRFVFGGQSRAVIKAEQGGPGIVLKQPSVADHTAPPAGGVVLFTRMAGANTQLCVRFATGAVQVLAAEGGVSSPPSGGSLTLVTPSDTYTIPTIQST